MLWIAIHLPMLPLEALTPSCLETPIGLQTATRCVVDRHIVRVPDTIARAQGVHEGMRKATALALVPHLQILEQDFQKEARFVQSIALALLRFTPLVSLEPNGILMEVQGSLRLFGGLRSLRRQVAQVIKTCGATYRMATASTASGALLLARSTLMNRYALSPDTTCRRLARVGIECISALDKHRETLVGLGCTTLGTFQALPRAGVKRRFGAQALQELDRAEGRTPDLRAFFTPPERFSAELDLLARVDHAEALVWASRWLIEQLCGWLAAHWTAVTVFRLVMRHESTRRAQPPSALSVALANPSRDPKHLLTVLTERLQRWQLAAPVYQLGLEVEAVTPFAGENQSFLPDPRRTAADFTRLIDQLSARLGADQVHRLALTEDFRPEYAFRSVQAHEHYPPAVNAPALPRPVWLLNQPIKLEERRNRPFFQSPLVLMSRPERIEYGWHDGALVQRDYYVAENANHALFWIYQERNALEGAWYLQGLFG